MSRRVTITDDAAGISDPAKERTGSVVEQLLAAPPAADTALAEIPTERIHNHPRNRRILDDDVADIVAGLKAGEPILNALGVTAAADWNAGKPDDLAEIPPGDYMITAGGHRRLRAAELAGLKTVPCIVRATFAGGAGRRAALLENVQRKDLDEFEQAEAIAELVAEPYKMSQRDIAKMLDCNQSHVSKRLKLLKLPTTVRESVRLNKMPIADALELARVADQGPIFDRALASLQRSGWITAKRAVDDAIAEHERLVATEKGKAKAAELGLQLLDRHPDLYAYSVREPIALEGLNLDADKHSGEPCHRGYVSNQGEIFLACATPAEHLKAGASTLKVSRSLNDRLKEGGNAGKSRSQVEGDALRRQLKKTQKQRIETAHLILLPLSIEITVEQELVDRASIGHVFHRPGSANDVAKIVLAILGLETPKGVYPANRIEELQRKSRTDLATVDHSVLAMVTAAAYFETRLMSSWRSWDDDDRFWLQLLAANGYELSDVERKRLDKIPAATAAPEEEPVADVRQCVKCGCTDDQACDGGCTWVAENLCSSCSDAVDGGFLDEHEQLLAASEAVG